MSDSELDACSYSIAQQLGHLLFSCSECVSQALSKLILAVLKGVHTLTNLPPRAMSSETEQRTVKCMRLQSIYGAIICLIPRSLPKLQLLEVPILEQKVVWGARNETNAEEHSAYNTHCKLLRKRKSCSVASLISGQYQHRMVWEIGMRLMHMLVVACKHASICYKHRRTRLCHKSKHNFHAC